MTCSSFSSSGSLRNIFVFVESSLRSTRKSFWASMISVLCLSSCFCRAAKSMSRHFDSAVWNTLSASTVCSRPSSSSSIGSIVGAVQRGAGRFRYKFGDVDSSVAIETLALLSTFGQLLIDPPHL
jgi:hypothetical protein